MSILINLIIFILVLTVIVTIHEFGHFIWAKWAGVYVYEFAIGMGPVIFQKQYGETMYSLRAIPIGGFCQLAGEDLDDDDAKKVPKEKRLQNKTCLQRFLIMVFGPLNNFILAVVILLLLALIWGGTTMSPKLTAVEEGSAAYKAGLREGVTIVSVNGKKVFTSDDLALYLAVADPTKKTVFEAKAKNGIVSTYKVKPEKIKKDDQVSYKYGIAMQQKKTHGFSNALNYTYKKTISIFKQMFITVSYLVTGGVKLNQLSGPVGIYSVVGEQAKGGIANILYLVAFLSINVGFINLLPIPAFDGGHILFIIIEKLKGSPVKPEIENKIHTIFLILLMLLMLVVTISDVIKLF